MTFKCPSCNKFVHILDQCSQCEHGHYQCNSCGDEGDLESCDEV